MQSGQVLTDLFTYVQWPERSVCVNAGRFVQSFTNQRHQIYSLKIHVIQLVVKWIMSMIARNLKKTYQIPAYVASRQWTVNVYNIYIYEKYGRIFELHSCNLTSMIIILLEMQCQHINVMSINCWILYNVTIFKQVNTSHVICSWIQHTFSLINFYTY